MNRSLLDVGGGVLVVSQFTLYANARKGRRPSYIEAAQPDEAQLLIQRFAECLAEAGVKRIEQGVFGALMSLVIHNDGPVTIMLDSEQL